MTKQMIKLVKMYWLTLVLCLPIIALGFGIVVLGTSSWLKEMNQSYSSGVGFGVLVAMFIVTFLIYRLNAKLFKKIITEITMIYNNYMMEKSKRNLKKINHYLQDRKYYYGKTKIYKELSPANGIILISIITLVGLIFALKSVYGALLIWSPYFIVLVYNYCFRTITISEKGILAKTWFKKTFIKWEQVQSIGVTTAYGYVSKNKYSEKRLVRKSKNTITFTYRSKIFHHIYAYWDGEIIDLEFKKAWIKYLKKHAEFDTTKLD